MLCVFVRACMRMCLCVSMSSLIPVGDTVTSTSEARHDCEWIESNKVSHIMSRENPPQSRKHTCNNQTGFFLSTADQFNLSLNEML